MSGLGNSALGTSPFGLGTPVAAAVLPTGSAGSRFIAPGTGDYEHDAETGQLKQMPRSRQKVLLALKTERGSSSVLREFGLLRPRKIDGAIERTAYNAVRAALYHLTDVERCIRLDSVLVGARAGGRLTLTVAFTDLETGLVVEPVSI
jgi:phage baseplate assembly protein W